MATAHWILFYRSRNLPSESFGDNLRKARDELLGPVKEMGPDVPVDGLGGTAFERSGYAKPVEDGARAYPILTTVQTGAGNTVGPGQFMKVRVDYILNLRMLTVICRFPLRTVIVMASRCGSMR